MANPKHLEIIKQGVAAWNAWRENNPMVQPDLQEADLSKANLSGANLRRARLNKANLEQADLLKTFLSGADLSGADLYRAAMGGAKLDETRLFEADLSEARLYGVNLRAANLFKANLSEAHLDGADLREANFFKANLLEANLIGADLREANLGKARLERADLEEVSLSETIFADTNLTGAKHLETCVHAGSSLIDARTLATTPNLPAVFLRNCLNRDWEIEAAKLYRKYLTRDEFKDTVKRICNIFPFIPNPHYSCFISYSHEDQRFTRKLHAALEKHDIRCWIDDADMRGGDVIREKVDEAIRKWDKVLLCCSEESLKSEWVNYELERTLAIEEDHEEPVRKLILLVLDDNLKSWQSRYPDLFKSRVYIDYKEWEDANHFDEKLNALLKALKVE